MPKVSILVPVYNVEKYIERCAISLFEQTFDDIEYVFVNDCTPDNSIEILQTILERYPNRASHIKIIHHEINKGLAGARNTAVKNAAGDYILHVDSDDYIELNAIEELYKTAINDNADIVVFDFFLEWGSTKKLVVQNWDEDKFIFINKILSVDAMPSVWNKFFKRSLYYENNIQVQEGINFGEDFVTTPKLIYHSKKISKVSNPFYHYIQTNTSSYTKSFNKKSIDNIICSLENLTKFFKSKTDYNKFQESLLISKLRKKIEFVFNSDVDYWDELFFVFPEVNELNDLNFLTIRERIIYFFITNNSKFGLKIYKKFYNIAFQILQRAKGRG